jgi:3-oxoadipate enol-lactonase
MHATRVTGERIYYEVFGARARGPWVVLVQGLGLSGRFWFDLPTRLANDGYRVIVLDNRGVGRSSRPRGPYKMLDMADDVIEAMDAAGANSAYVVGISLGGMIAQHVALRHPARVDGLVLLATTCGVPHGSLPPLRMLASLLAVGVTARKSPGAALSRILLPKSHLSRAREILSDWPAALALEPTGPLTFLAQFAAAAAHSTGFRLGEIRCPTAVVTGDADILIPPKNSHVLAARIKGAHLEVLPNVGHGVPLLDEAVVHRALERVGARAQPFTPFVAVR